MQKIEDVVNDLDDKIRKLKRKYKKEAANNDNPYTACYARLALRVMEGYHKWYMEETERDTPVEIIFSALLGWTGSNIGNILYNIFDDPDDDELISLITQTIIECMKDRVDHIRSKEEV